MHTLIIHMRQLLFISNSFTNNSNVTATTAHSHCYENTLYILYWEGWIWALNLVHAYNITGLIRCQVPTANNHRSILSQVRYLISMANLLLSNCLFHHRTPLYCSVPNGRTEKPLLESHFTCHKQCCVLCLKGQGLFKILINKHSCHPCDQSLLKLYSSIIYFHYKNTHIQDISNKPKINDICIIHHTRTN